MTADWEGCKPIGTCFDIQKRTVSYRFEVDTPLDGDPEPSD
jgi:hypothetical protein